MRPAHLSVLAAVVVFAAPARSSAETVTLALTGYPNGSGNVTLNGTTIDAAPIGPLSWTQYNPGGTPYNRPPNLSFPNPLNTFCIELGSGVEQQIDPTKQYTFGVKTDLTQAPTIGANANAVLLLYGKDYTAAIGAGGAGSVAFQLALWGVIYNGLNADPNSLTDGSQPFSVSAAAFPEVAQAQGWVNALYADRGQSGQAAFDANAALAGEQLVALVAPAGYGTKLQTPTQDQLALRPNTVPAPPGVVLAGLGLVALAGRRRWKGGRVS